MVFARMTASYHCQLMVFFDNRTQIEKHVIITAVHVLLRRKMGNVTT